MVHLCKLEVAEQRVHGDFGLQIAQGVFVGDLDGFALGLFLGDGFGLSGIVSHEPLRIGIVLDFFDEFVVACGGGMCGDERAESGGGLENI